MIIDVIYILAGDFIYPGSVRQHVCRQQRRYAVSLLREASALVSLGEVPVYRCSSLLLQIRIRT